MNDTERRTAAAIVVFLEDGTRHNATPAFARSFQDISVIGDYGWIPVKTGDGTERWVRSKYVVSVWVRYEGAS